MNYIYSTVLCVSFCLHALYTPTLHDLDAYIQRLHEFPPLEKVGPSNHGHKEYYQSLHPNFFERIVQRFSSRSHYLNGYAFKDILDAMIKQREEENLSGRPIVKLITEEPITLYVVGQLHADIHTFMRIIQDWHQRGIIDENLRLTHTTDYLVINGNLIDHGAHSLECLYITLLLLHRNQHQVFYLRGQHEDNQRWIDHNFKHELKERLAYFIPYKSPADTIPLQTDINRFFNTLPLALYIADKSNPLQVIRISPQTRTATELYEERFNHFFLDHLNQPISYYDIRHIVMSQQYPIVQALITTQNSFKERYQGTGLVHLMQDKGSTAWAIVSSTEQNMQHEVPRLDAYAAIAIKQPLQESTITLYNRVHHQDTSFKVDGTFNLLTGRSLTNGHAPFKLPDVVIGSTMGLESGLTNITRPIKFGFDLAIRQQNNADGLQGHYVRTFVYNDDAQPKASRDNIERLITTDKTSLIVLPTGSANLHQCLDLIKEHRISVFFPVTGDDSLYTSDLTSLIHLRPSYAQEIYALMDHLHNSERTSKFLILYQDDIYGVESRKAAEAFLTHHGITDAIFIPCAVDQTNFTQELKKLHHKGFNAVGLLATSPVSRQFLHSLGIDHLMNKKIFCPSFVADSKIKQFIHIHGLHAYFASPVPSPFTSNLAIVQEYRNLMDTTQDTYDVFSLEGYIATRILLDAMQNLPLPITGNALMHKLEAYRNYDIKGFNLTFNPALRALSSTVWIDTGTTEPWIEKKMNTQNI